MIASEIQSSVKSVVTSFVNEILKTDFDVSFYDFSNAYVLFTENLAEWYSLVGFENGAYGEAAKVPKNKGIEIGSSRYKCQGVFSSLVSENIVSADNIIDIIKSDAVVTFQEFYNSLVRKYPVKKDEIKSIFKDSYKSDGNPLKY